MPKILPGLIEHIGAQNTVQELLRRGIENPSEIADRLNQEPSYKTLAKTFGKAGRQSIIAKDVELYLKEEGKAGVIGDADSEGKALQESPRAQSLVKQVGDRVNGLIRQAEASEYILKTTLQDVERLQRKWRQYMDDGVTKKNRDGVDVEPEYPVKEITALCRVVETQLKMVSALKGDDKVQQLMRANTVNVSQGMSREEFFEEMFAICDVLGHTRQEVVAAYSKFMSKPKIIDADEV